MNLKYNRKQKVIPWIALRTAPDGTLNYMWNGKMKCEVNDINFGSFRTWVGVWDLIRIKLILFGVVINMLVKKKEVMITLQ